MTMKITLGTCKVYWNAFEIAVQRPLIALIRKLYSKRLTSCKKKNSSKAEVVVVMKVARGHGPSMIKSRSTFETTSGTVVSNWTGVEITSESAPSNFKVPESSPFFRTITNPVSIPAFSAAT